MYRCCRIGYVLVPWLYIHTWDGNSLFLEWWNTTKSLSNIWQGQWTRGLQKYARNLISMIDFWGKTKPRQGKKLLPDWLDWLSFVAGKSKPPWDFSFLHIFAIPPASRQEEHCQTMEILFVVLHHSRNILCEGQLSLKGLEFSSKSKQKSVQNSDNWCLTQRYTLGFRMNVCS